MGEGRMKLTKYYIWTGPTQVKQVAEALQFVGGVYNVIEGTEKVIFESEGDESFIEISMSLSKEYVLLRSFRGNVRKLL
jgi:hypothetical protein